MNNVGLNKWTIRIKSKFNELGVGLLYTKVRNNPFKTSLEFKSQQKTGSRYLQNDTIQLCILSGINYNVSLFPACGLQFKKKNKVRKQKVPRLVDLDSNICVKTEKWKTAIILIMKGSADESKHQKLHVFKWSATGASHIHMLGCNHLSVLHNHLK